MLLFDPPLAMLTGCHMLRMVEELLEKQAEAMGWRAPSGRSTALDAIFMIGDNPRGRCSLLLPSPLCSNVASDVP